MFPHSIFLNTGYISSSIIVRVQAGDLEVSSLMVQAASLRTEVHTGALVLSVAAHLGQVPSTSVFGDFPK